MSRRQHSEKVLFVTIWLLIGIAYGLWRLSATPKWTPRARSPDLHLTKGIQSLFSHAWIEEVSPTFIRVGLTLSDRYRARLQDREGNQLSIGFELRGGNSVLSRGTAPCVVTRDVAGTIVQLENPDRISPQEIHLYLPH